MRLWVFRPESVRKGLRVVERCRRLLSGRLSEQRLSIDRLPNSNEKPSA
jgi:hypothetical protein